MGHTTRLAQWGHFEIRNQISNVNNINNSIRVLFLGFCTYLFMYLYLHHCFRVLYLFWRHCLMSMYLFLYHDLLLLSLFQYRCLQCKHSMHLAPEHWLGERAADISRCLFTVQCLFSQRNTHTLVLLNTSINVRWEINNIVNIESQEVLTGFNHTRSPNVYFILSTC